MSIGISVTVDGDFPEVAERVRDALKAEGFGIVSEIDIAATFRQKLGVEFRPYLILGACNPTLAKKAIEAMPEIGLLLPCNVTVEQEDGRVKVTAVDPFAMLAAAPKLPALEDVASDAKPRLERALETLSR